MRKIISGAPSVQSGSRFAVARLAAAIMQSRRVGPSVAVGATALILGATYCLGYALLSGDRNDWVQALGWSFGAVLPWFLVAELIRRIELRSGQTLPMAVVGLMLLATGALSLGIEAVIDRFVWQSDSSPLALQLLRRLPAIGIVTLFLLISRLVERPTVERAAQLSDFADQLRYVKAADNYLELYLSDRMTMRRQTLADAAAELAPLGFVRIHRSIIVHPRAVARVVPDSKNTVLVLTDTTELSVGRRYRAAIRHFVP